MLNEDDGLFGFSFVPNQRCLSLYMFFENGEHARRVMEPKEDEVIEI